MPHHKPTKAKRAADFGRRPTGVVASSKPWRAQARTAQNLALAVAMYDQGKDRTLTASQAKTGFRPKVVADLSAFRRIPKGSFRFASNPTSRGFSSGYHEAFVVTDMTDKLSSRSRGSGGMSAMPSMTSGFWKKHSGKAFPERNVSALVQAGDGARTDTARTILSGPGGAVAGHSGSGVNTSGQSSAHDLLRDQAMRTLSDPHMTPGAAGVIAAATTVFSMAPGQLASRAKNAGKLKDQSARATWEDARNEAKERLAVANEALSPPERLMVRRHMAPLVLAIGGGRHLEADRPSSPRRERVSTSGGAISGGGYDPHAHTTGSPSKGLSPTADPRQVAQYVSEPFRVQRRSI